MIKSKALRATDSLLEASLNLHCHASALGTIALLALCSITAADAPQEGRWRELPEKAVPPINARWSYGGSDEQRTLTAKLHALSNAGTLGPMQPRTSRVRRVI